MTLYDICWAALEGLGIATVIIALVRWGLKAERQVSESDRIDADFHPVECDCAECRRAELQLEAMRMSKTETKCTE